MIQCQDSAFKNIINWLHDQGLDPTPINSYNKGRHLLVLTNKGKFYLIYKRDFFNTFEKEFHNVFQKYPNLEGVGESINKDYLEFCIKIDVMGIIFIHPNKSYQIIPMLIKKFCENNGLVRKQKKTNIYKCKFGKLMVENELTYIFPMKLLTELDFGQY